jgi:hypothetical protein
VVRRSRHSPQVYVSSPDYQNKGEAYDELRQKAVMYPRFDWGFQRVTISEDVCYTEWKPK